MTNLYRDKLLKAVRALADHGDLDMRLTYAAGCLLQIDDGDVPAERFAAFDRIRDPLSEMALDRASWSWRRGVYPYRSVERALTRTHGDSGAAAMRISNRLKHLIRIGLTPETPGKGRHISYSFEDAVKWAYAFQILEYGLDPTSMLLVIQQTWRIVWHVMQKETNGQNELMVAVPNAISHPDGWRFFDFDIYQYQTYQPDWTSVKRIMIINLSMISRDLRSALAEAEAGTLRDLSEEVERIKAGEATFAHANAALRNTTPDAALAISGRPLVQEQAGDGTWPVVLPRLPKSRRPTKPET